MRINMLDLFQISPSALAYLRELKTLTLPLPSAQVDLQALQLSDACALLSHAGAAAMPLAGENDTAYLQRVIDLLCDLSLKDPLTGLANRRHFLAILERELSILARSGESTLLLMLDIDHFKNVNDTYGHPVGDQVLQAVASCLKSCVRPKDTVVRYGGEEFAVVLPDCHVTFGMVVAERMREMIQAMSIKVSPSVSINVTMSIGGAYAPQTVDSNSGTWIELSDKELYRAKTSGRNRVCIDQPFMMEVSPEEKSQLFVDFSQNDSRWGSSLYGDLTDDTGAEPSPGNAAEASPNDTAQAAVSASEKASVALSANTQESPG